MAGILAGAVQRVISMHMDQEIKPPKLSGTAKLDATTEAAYAIIDKRDMDRESKTAKLKALRLEKEAAERAAGVCHRTSRAQHLRPSARKHPRMP
jgi:hypothetical protein